MELVSGLVAQLHLSAALLLRGCSSLGAVGPRVPATRWCETSATRRAAARRDPIGTTRASCWRGCMRAGRERRVSLAA